MNDSQRVLSLSISSNDVLISELSDHLNKNIIQIFGRCTARFDGRINSELGDGDRILLIKPDGTLLLHGFSGVKPLNWQKPGAGRIEFRIVSATDDNASWILEMYTYRPKTKESFSIAFDILYNISVFAGKDEVNLHIAGNEADLQDYLVTHPEVIEEGFKILDREIETPLGFIDLLGIDKDNIKVYIELKKGSITPADVFQLQRYRNVIEKTLLNEHFRTMLIGSSIADKSKSYLKKHHCEYKELKWQEIFPTIPRTKAKSLNQFF